MSNKENRSHGILGLIIVIAAVVLILKACSRGGGSVSGASIFRAYIMWTSIAAVAVIVIAAAILLTLHFTNKKKVEPQQPVDPADEVLKKNNEMPKEAFTSSDPRVKALVPFATVKDVGKVASHGIRQLLALDQKEKQLMDLVEQKFMKGSITYDRFASTILAGTDTVRQNADVLADKMANFDGDEYYRISQSVETGAFRRDMVDDEVQLARYDAYHKQIAEMKRIIDANEKLMLTLDECNVELSRLVSNQLDQHSEEILTEITELSKTTKYYS